MTFTISNEKNTIHVKLHKTAYKSSSVLDDVWEAIISSWRFLKECNGITVSGGKHIKKMELDAIKKTLELRMIHIKNCIRNHTIMNKLS